MFDAANTGLPAEGSARYIHRADLVGSVGLVGAGYTFVQEVPPEERLLHGHFDTLRLRPGLILHTACVRDLRTMSTSNHLYPGIKIALLVDGATDLSYGHHRFRLGPGWPDAGGGRQGALVNLAEEDRFSRRWEAGRTERKVSLTLTPEWLEQGALQEHGAYRELERFRSEHLATVPWTASPRACELARRILGGGALAPGMERLRLESRCVELAAEALGAIGMAAPVPEQALRPAQLRRLAALEELLRAMPAETMSMAEIARQLCSNPVSLQALARRQWGCSVFERLRALRMARAHDLLAGGASVAQAAEAAGFSTAANFSTAYKRCYGSSPRHVWASVGADSIGRASPCARDGGGSASR